MLKKIFLILILLLIFTFIQPNWPILQGFNTKTPPKDNTDAALYRNNPAKYFEIMLNKQKANATNIYLLFKMSEDLIEEYYKYNSFSKEVTRTNNTNTVILSKGKSIYSYIETITGDKKSYPWWFAIKFSNAPKSVETLAHIIYKKEDFEKKNQYINQKYIGQKSYLDRTCSIWKSQTKNGITEQCIDEELGISYYQTSYFYPTRKTIKLYEIIDIKINQNDNKTFDIPRDIKAVLNLFFIKA